MDNTRVITAEEFSAFSKILGLAACQLTGITVQDKEAAEERWLTPSEASNLAGVTTQTLKNWASRKQIRGQKIGGRWRYSSLDIAAINQQ